MVISPRIAARRRTQAPVPGTSKKSKVKVSDYDESLCEKCGSGENAAELLLCDKCDKGFHLFCLRPILAAVPKGSWFCPACSVHIQTKPKSISMTQTKIVDFFRIQRCSQSAEKFNHDCKKKRKRTTSLGTSKKKRKLLPFSPSEDTSMKYKQMQSLAVALTATGADYSNELTYFPGMAPRSANCSTLEREGMQVMSKEDTDTLNLCKSMMERGEWPPLMVVFDPIEGFTVEADKTIRDLTIITEYVGDVDYLKKRENDDGDSMMTLISAADSSKSLVICPDKRSNIARFINGINNHTREGKKKQNVKCVRFDVNGEARVLLIATRDIHKGERLYYDYNGYEHEYPTQHFALGIKAKMFAKKRYVEKALMKKTPVIDQNFYYAGLKFTSPTFSCAMSNMLPAMTFVMAVLCRMEILDMKKVRCQAKVLGTALTVAGAMLMTLYKGKVVEMIWSSHIHPLKSSTPGTPVDADKDWVKGSILLIIATFAWASFFILQNVTMRRYTAPLSLTSLVCFMGTLQSIAVTFAMEHRANVWQIGFDMNLLAAAYAGIVSSSIAYYVQGLVMEKRGPVFVTAFSPLMMIIVAVMGSFILAEKIFLGGILGAVLIVIGLYSVLWGKYKEYKDKEAEEFLEPVKDTNNNNAMMMIKDIEANNVQVMHKNEGKTVMSPAAFAISAPIPTLPMLAVEAPKP